MNPKVVRILAIVFSVLAIVLAALSLFVWRYLLFAAFGCVILSAAFNLILLKIQRAMMARRAIEELAQSNPEEPEEGQSQDDEQPDEEK